jgi:hypothetical protein
VALAEWWGSGRGVESWVILYRGKTMRRLKRFGTTLWGLPRGRRERRLLDAYLAQMRARIISELEQDLTAGLNAGPGQGRWVRMKDQQSWGWRDRVPARAKAS